MKARGLAAERASLCATYAQLWVAVGVSCTVPCCVCLGSLVLHHHGMLLGHCHVARLLPWVHHVPLVHWVVLLWACNIPPRHVGLGLSLSLSLGVCLGVRVRVRLRVHIRLSLWVHVCGVHAIVWRLVPRVLLHPARHCVMRILWRQLWCHGQAVSILSTMMVHGMYITMIGILLVHVLV